MDIQQAISVLQSKKDYLAKRYHVSQIGVFGSVARNEGTTDSDLDVLVDFSEPIGIEFVMLAEELEQILGIKVDLVSRHGIKPKYFQHISKDIVYA